MVRFRVTLINGAVIERVKIIAQSVAGDMVDLRAGGDDLDPSDWSVGRLVHVADVVRIEPFLLPNGN
jgi:hypothetical protein